MKWIFKTLLIYTSFSVGEVIKFTFLSLQKYETVRGVFTKCNLKQIHNTKSIGLCKKIEILNI